ncbi:MAG: transposase [Schwartzia sp. (in: firmicutes)]
MANDALDTVRKEVQGKLGKENRKAFKHSRKFLLKREKTLMFRQTTEK